MNPSDPARHELYHRIRHEDWFVNQTRERSITGREASRIPGSVPGDSVLLAFFKKVKDSKDKPAMHCTICLQTRGASKFYSRPDRAKVHIRHHFELRPVLCDRRCGITLCVQRFFTKADLEAHVAGRTEAPVPCEYCQKPLLAKNPL
ncbi:hypothetical protein M408DRAFT_295820 [Serendipita vermifera MAFF 305830]|uniref:C2H2-type domain-containing protein n=1 Tax=Serendipita vermifera MAFF 305830 TaxID=933852 RepID=A0A0C3BFL7_SERVB|nr:hypothetical protein M408DRAFT_295820 [Serendipita vermifera MAFF 305830]